jgi:hypothetical protein
MKVNHKLRALSQDPLTYVLLIWTLLFLSLGVVYRWSI